MKQALAESLTFTVTFLSPVHIGTEEQLDDHDCLCEGNRFVRLRIGEVLEKLPEHLTESFIHDGLEGIKEWLRRNGVLERARLYEVTVPRAPRWGREPLRPFIADPLLRPYLPGTEVKGAIRMAVAWWLVQRSDKNALRQLVGKRQRNGQIANENDRRQAGAWLEQTLLGAEPNHDLLRGLRVLDSLPVEPRRLKVIPVLVAVRTNRGLQWLQRPRQRNQRSEYTDNIANAVANFCECLDESVNGVTITVVEDRFLTRGAIAKSSATVSVPKELAWDERNLAAVAEWRKACNALAKWVAEREQKWWEEVRRQSGNSRAQLVAAAMERFYAELLKRMNAEETRAIFLNLGWGGGWRTKTVTEAFGDETVQQVVRSYGLDRGAHSNPFPKTRKVAWLGGNEYRPLGWIRLAL